MVEIVKALGKIGESSKSEEKFWNLEKKLRNVMEYEGHIVYVEWYFLFYWDIQLWPSCD